MSRSIFIEQFELSVKQTSSNMNPYIGFTPNNMVYNTSALTDARGSGFAAKLQQPSASRYFAQLHSLADCIISSDDISITGLPPCDTAQKLVRGVEDSEVKDAADANWQMHVTLEVGSYLELSEYQKKVIALDYGMSGEKAQIKVRRALLYYALKRLGLDTAPGARKPQDQQIVLLNREAVHETNG